MIKRLLLPLLALSLLALAACATNPTPTPSPTPTATATPPASPPPFVDLHPERGEPFEIRIGQSAFIDEEGYRIDFTGVLQDSRCPTASHCPVPDVAVIEVSVRETAEDTPQTYELFFDSGPSVTTIGDYDIHLLGLEPSQEQVTGPQDYRLTMLVVETPTPELEVDLTASTTTIAAGEPFTVSAGSGGSGLAQYTLTIENAHVSTLRYDGTQARGNETPVVEIGEYQADADTASWMLRVTEPGTFELTVTVTGEVPLSQPDTYGWAQGSDSFTLTVE